MASLEVIPAIDLRGGQVVRLAQGDYARETIYDADPGARAAAFVAQGARHLHVVDLEAARDGVSGNESAIRSILAAAAPVPVQLGGGMRSLARIEEVLGWGVDRVIVGTALLDTPELVPEVARTHPGRLILGLDARDGVLAVRGWRESAGLPVEELLDRFADLPLGGILHTDIGVDGLLKGPNVKATAALARRTQHPVIASGGVGTLEHLVELARVRVIAAVVVGRALYSGAIDLEQALATVARC